MRWWSIHPRYFDKSGLIAAWREGLQMQKALQNGEDDDPTLACFKYASDPLRAVGAYLSFLAAEGSKRGYKLAHERILYPNFDQEFVPLDNVRFGFDAEEMHKKLSRRSEAYLRELPAVSEWEMHPVFAPATQASSANYTINNNFEGF